MSSFFPIPKLGPNRRLLLKGHKSPKFRALDVTFANREPLWAPRPNTKTVIDADLVRKQRLEDKLSEAV